MKRKKGETITPIGFSSILIVFVMLALVTFTVLSVITANADYKLSKKVAQKTTSYYTANNNAEILLNDIDERLHTLYQKSASADDYFAMVPSALADLTQVGIQEDTASVLTASYSCDISDTQEIDVRLEICYPTDDADGFYKILSWQTNTELPESSDTQTYHLLGK